MPETETLAASPIGEALHFHDGAIDKLADLGAKAQGVEIVEIEYPDAAFGLPSRFPLALVAGDMPKILGLRDYAEAWRDRPERRAGQAKALTLASFIDLFNRHKTEDSVTFADSTWTAPSLTAVLDYHPVDAPGLTDNGGHRIRYDFPLSPEWKAWVEGDGQPMAQIDFAAMIEDRIADLTSPLDDTRIWMERDFQTTIATPAQLITLSRGLAVNVEAKVKDFKTLQSGAGQLVFEESHTGADGKPLQVPGLFVLLIAPFFEGDKIEIPVRLRYRVRQGQIVWLYQIYRPDQSITEAVRHAIGDVRIKTERSVYEGAPEMDVAGKPVRG